MTEPEGSYRKAPQKPIIAQGLGLGYRTRSADEAACMLALGGVRLNEIKPATNLYIPGTIDFREGRHGRNEFVIESEKVPAQGGITPGELGAAWKAGDEDEKLDSLLDSMEDGAAVSAQEIRRQVARALMCYGHAVLENRREIERGRTKPRDQVLVRTSKGRVLLPRTDWTTQNRKFARHCKVI